MRLPSARALGPDISDPLGPGRRRTPEGRDLGAGIGRVLPLPEVRAFPGKPKAISAWAGHGVPLSLLPVPSQIAHDAMDTCSADQSETSEEAGARLDNRAAQLREGGVEESEVELPLRLSGV